MIAWLIALSVAAQGTAQGTLDADPRFVQAVTAFRALEYEMALGGFDQLAAEDRPPADVARLLAWSGAARALLGDDVAARLMFESALKLDPACALEMNTSPKVRALFDDAKEKLRAQQEDAARKEVERKEAERQAALANPTTGSSASGSSPNAQQPADRRRGSDTVGAPFPLWLGSGAGLVLGTASAAASLFLIVQARSNADLANNALTAQQDVPALIDDANARLLASTVFAGGAVVLLGAGVTCALVALGWSEEPPDGDSAAAANGGR